MAVDRKEVQTHKHAIALIVLRGLMVAAGLGLLTLLTASASDLVSHRSAFGRDVLVLAAYMGLLGVFAWFVLHRKEDRPIVREAFWGLLAGSLAATSEAWGRIGSASTWLGKLAARCSGWCDRRASVARETRVEKPATTKPQPRVAAVSRKDVLRTVDAAVRQHQESIAAGTAEGS